MWRQEKQKEKRGAEKRRMGLPNDEDVEMLSGQKVVRWMTGSSFRTGARGDHEHKTKKQGGQRRWSRWRWIERTEGKEERLREREDMRTAGQE